MALRDDPRHAGRRHRAVPCGVARWHGCRGNAVLQNAWLLFMLPHSIVAVSIATAYFTRMSHDAGRGDLDAVRRNLSLSLRIVGLFTVFASVALIVVAVPFGRMFGGTFEQALSIGAVLVAYMPVSCCSACSSSSSASSGRCTTTAHRSSCSACSPCSSSSALSPSRPSRRDRRVSIAACTTLAGTAQTIIALILVRRRLNGIEGPWWPASHCSSSSPRSSPASSARSSSSPSSERSPPTASRCPTGRAPSSPSRCRAAMAVVYFGVLVVARNGEIANAVKLLRGRLGR